MADTQPVTPDETRFIRRLEPASISQRVYAALEAAITQCELPPSSELSDRRLAEQFGVSRTPVREALAMLELSGMVQRRDRSGWIVAGFSEQDVHDLFEVRRLIEPQGVRRLADPWDDAAVYRLIDLFSGFPYPLPPERYHEYLLRDNEFHKGIIEGSTNSRIITFYAIIEKQIDRIRHFLAGGYRGRIDEVYCEHERLIAAMRAHDRDAAIAALVHHLEMGERNMMVFAREKLWQREDG